MAANLPKALRIEHKRRAWGLAMKGVTQAEIARELGITQQQVSHYLAATARKAHEQLEDAARTYVMLSLGQTDQVLFEAMKAFERSTKPKKRARKTSPDGSTRGDSPVEGRTTTEVTEREGEPAWLATVMAAIRLRHELLPVPTTEKAEDDSGDGTVAGALLDAERRDAAYRDTTETTEETRTDAE